MDGDLSEVRAGGASSTFWSVAQDAFRRPAGLVASLAITPRQTVAQIGLGGGDLTPDLALVVFTPNPPAPSVTSPIVGLGGTLNLFAYWTSSGAQSTVSVDVVRTVSAGLRVVAAVRPVAFVGPARPHFTAPI